MPEPVETLTARYAIYYLPPPDSALGRFGRSWFGRDVEAGRDMPAIPLPGFDKAAHATLIDAPRRYGLHATLKAPFRLARGRTVQDLETAAETFAAQTAPVAGISLNISSIGPFLALVPDGGADGLQELANECVSSFDTLREPLRAADRARRRPETLNARQRDYLDRWGYPYVLEEFRFHITLTGPLPGPLREHVQQALSPRVEPIIRNPIAIDAISIAVQPEPEAPFRLHRSFPLADSR